MENEIKNSTVLVQIQNELKVPKGNFNSFGRYKYRSAEDILETVKPLLLKYSATLTLTDSVEAAGGKKHTVKDGDKETITEVSILYVKSTAVLRADDEVYTVTAYAETSEHKGMSTEQATGTASSYARKYALNGLFLIDETESDPDTINTGDKKSKMSITHPKFADALKAIKEGKATIKDVKAKYELSTDVEEQLLEAEKNAK